MNSGNQCEKGLLEKILFPGGRIANIFKLVPWAKTNNHTTCPSAPVGPTNPTGEDLRGTFFTADTLSVKEK